MPIKTEDLFNLNIEPTSSTAVSDTDSPVLLKQIEAQGPVKTPKDELEVLEQIPGYYGQERTTPDPNVGFFPTDTTQDPLVQPTDQISNQIAEFYTIQEGEYQKDKFRLSQISSEEAAVYKEQNNPNNLSQEELDAKLLGDLVFFADPDILGGNAPSAPKDMYGIDRPKGFYNQSDELLAAREAFMLAETNKAKGFVFKRNNNDPKKVDKEISNYSPSLLSEEDREIQALIRKGDQLGADALAEEKGYVKLYNPDGSFKDYMPAEQASKAIDLATTDLDVLRSKQREIYSRMIAAQSLANRNIVGGFGGKKYGVGITDHMSSILGGDLQANYIMSNTASAASVNSQANQLINKVQPIPGSSPIAEEHNRTLNQLKTITQAIELNMNPELLPETGRIIGFQEVFEDRDLTTVSNDERAEIFHGITEEIGLKPKSEFKREGDYYGRSVVEGARDFVDDFAELAASIYITKRIPVGAVKKGQDVLTLEAGMTSGVNAINKAIKASTKSRTVQRFSEVGLGAVKEIVTLGGADVVGDHLFGVDGFVYNKKTKDVHLAFPAALGAGNVISKKILNKVLRTESNFTRTLGMLNKGVENGTLSAIGTATVGAATGTAVLTFGELVAHGLSPAQQFRQMEDGNFETIDEWKEIMGGRKLLETFIGMYMLGGKGTATNMYKGMKADIARIVRGSTARGEAAAKRMGIKINSTNDTIKTTANTKIKQINESNLSPEQKLERIKEVKADAESLYWHNEAMTAQRMAKKDNAYVEARKNIFALANNIKQNKELTPEQIQKFNDLKPYEFELMRAKLGVSKNSAFGQLLENKRDVYKSVIDAVNQSRVYEVGGSEARNESIKLWMEISDIGGQIKALEIEGKGSVVLEGVNKKKIAELKEKEKAIIEKLEQKGVEYDAILKDMMMTEVQFAKLMAKEMGAGFNLVGEAIYQKMGGKKGSEGFYNRETNQIYINEKAALKARQLGAPLHEITHAILRNALKETYIDSEGVERTRVSKDGLVKIKQFLNQLNPKERAAVEKRMEEQYKYEKDSNNEFILRNGKKIKKPENQYAEEYLTAFGDVLKNKEIRETSGLASRLSAFFTPLMRRYGFKNMQVTTESGRGLYNMIKAIQRSSETKTIDKDILNIVKTSKAVTGKAITESRTITKEMEQASSELDRIYKEEGMSGYNKIIERLKGKDAEGRQVGKDFIRQFTEIYKDHAKYPEFKDVLYDAMANDPTYGVLGSIMTYNPAKNPSIASHILGRLKQGKHIDVANIVLGKDAARQFTKSLDVAEAKEVESKQLSAEELFDIKQAEAKIAQAPNLRKSLKKGEEKGINQELIDKIENTVLKTFGTKLPLPKEKGFKKKLQDNYKVELKKPIADLMGKGPEYEVFLRDNFESIMKFVDKSFFVQMERLTPKKDRIFTEVEIERMNPTQTDKAISEGRVPKNTSRTAGNTLYRFKKPTPAEFIKFYLGANVKPSTKGTRKDRLAETLGIELAKDMTSQVISRPEVIAKIKEISKIELEGSIEGLDKPSQKAKEAREMLFNNYTEIVASEIARDPSKMFSETFKKEVKELRELVETKDNFNDVFSVVLRKPIVKRADGKDFSERAYKHVLESYENGLLDMNVVRFRDKKISETGKKITKGTGYELYTSANVSKQILSGLKNVVKIASEVTEKKMYLDPQGVFKGGEVQAPDFMLDWSGTKQVWELKYKSARTPKNSAGFINYSKAIRDITAGKEFKLTERKNPRKNAKEEAIFVQSVKNAILNGAPQIEAVLRERGILKKGEDFTSKTKIPLDIHNKMHGKEKALMADGSQKINGDWVATDYNKKGVFNFQMATKGAFLLGNSPTGIAKEAGATKLEGSFPLMTRIYSSSYKGANGKTAGYRYTLVGEGLISPKNITSKSKLNLDSPGALKKMANTPSAKRIKRMAEAEATAFKANKKKVKNLNVIAESKTNKKLIEKIREVDKGIELGRKINKESRGMSTFDFDETLIDKGKNFIVAIEPNTGKKVKISSGNWPIEGPKFAEQGYTFDFSDFVKVRGGIEGPMFKKFKERLAKFGPENMYVLTARPPEAATAIYGWLKSKGVEIPFENITGLGNSKGEAKAEWMLKKFSEGYNDMYFVDDALPNVKAVKNVLNQLDIKSDVQIAYSKTNLNKNINDIMESTFGIDSKKTFSKAEAKVRGKDIKRRRVFMRDSAADLELLIEPLYGKGKKGIENKKWFKKEFIIPFERGIRDYNVARQSAKNDYMNLRKQNKDVVKEISKEVKGTSFTNDMAMRIYLWNKAGYKIPDLAKTTEAKLVEYIQNNPKLQAYAEQFARITKQEKGLKEPGENWWAETMAGEVTSMDRGVSRKQYLQDFIERKNEIFSDVNLNKMESKLGTRWRENIVDMFDRMETGRTRSLKMDRGSAAMMNYLNGGIGTIMNFNTRSAMLQTISTVNFLNMRENNPIAAARAMGNVKQFSKDFMFIMNSPMLKQRRDGLSINVTEAEIASAAAASKNPIQSVIAKVLKAGYLPTKLADSFAISFGGATFYRNRIKMYEKQGMETKAAEKQAFLDFQVLSERTQQSSRADLLSKQQTSLIGRFILPFANTPMQMNRAGMKEILDISKGRYENNVELAEKIGRTSYYMGAQVAVFAGLQSALFAMLLNDEDVPEERIANTKSMMLNSTADSFLRGFGIQGAIISGFKNATQEYFKQSAKPGFIADYSEVGEDLLNISPPIGSKFGMLDRAGDRLRFGKDTPFKFELGNPKLEASLMSIQATTNAPVYSPYQNLFNLQHAMSDQYETWQRFLMATGWTPYSVGIEEEKKKKKKKIKRKKTAAEILRERQMKFLQRR